MKPLTLAPLPTVDALLAALVRPMLQDDILAAPWCRPDDIGFWFSRSAWSLLVIAEWRTRVTGKKPITIWLPDFFCNAALAPLREIGAQLFFYPVSDQLVPDLDACHNQIKEVPPDLFVLVHFFGQPAPADQALALCRNVGGWLVEDAAHVLRPIPGVGEHGDCVLYSPHKHLVSPDGAVLVIRGDGPSQLGRDTKAMTLLGEVTTALMVRSAYSRRPVAIWLMKRVLQLLGVRYNKHSTSFWPGIDTGNLPLPHPRMSILAKGLLSVQCDALDKVAQLRKQHCRIWQETLTGSGMIQPEMQSWSMSSTPYLASFIGKDPIRTEACYVRWQHAGLPVLTWPDLPPEVLADPVHHESALRLRQTRVYLPVHQSLSSAQISETCIPSGKNTGKP